VAWRTESRVEGARTTRLLSCDRSGQARGQEGREREDHKVSLLPPLLEGDPPNPSARTYARSHMPLRVLGDKLLSWARLTRFSQVRTRLALVLQELRTDRGAPEDQRLDDANRDGVEEYQVQVHRHDDEGEQNGAGALFLRKLTYE
jgi:hypothetical protein